MPLYRAGCPPTEENGAHSENERSCGRSGHNYAVERAMKRKTMWVAGATVVALVLVLAVLVGRGEGATSEYRFVQVERGDVLTTVSSTGKLQATRTVNVGTQVSGQVAELMVDFNDRVEAGQLIARIDPTLPLQEVRSAEANLRRSRAELEQAAREFERSRKLHAEQVVTTSELEQAEYQYSVAQASHNSAEINLERARRNLAYTEIRSPVDGVVVERNVDQGQTVASSLSTPTLFMIAEDLSRMEILATVDESDIGRIEAGQEARFTVQAYPDETFTGVVSQVRLQSQLQENVVSYMVVVSVANEEQRLLPGMTATVDFVVNRADDVLLVSNTALRFRPTQAMLRQATPPRGAGATLWYVDDAGRLQVAAVETGSSDMQNTAIRGEDVREGMQVIAAVTGDVAPAGENPFQQEGGRRRGGF